MQETVTVTLQMCTSDMLHTYKAGQECDPAAQAHNIAIITQTTRYTPENRACGEKMTTSIQEKNKRLNVSYG